jgi:hypothetical protein
MSAHFRYGTEIVCQYCRFKYLLPSIDRTRIDLLIRFAICPNCGVPRTIDAALFQLFPAEHDDTVHAAIEVFPQEFQDTHHPVIRALHRLLLRRS